jgi:hypothetical protein
MEVPPHYFWPAASESTNQTRGRAAGFAYMPILTVEFAGEKIFIPNAAIFFLPTTKTNFGPFVFAHP